MYGTGNFSFGYLGGVLDATTGLLYVGNGQHYDPATGRFLTRNVNPNSANPYVPWNPIGAILGPLGLIALVFGRKKKGSKAGTFLVLLLVVGSVGMTLAACGPTQPSPTPPPPQPLGEQPTIPSSNQTPQPVPTPTAPSAPIYLPIDAVAYALDYYNNPNPNYNYFDPNTGNTDCTNFVSQALASGSLETTPGIWEPYTLAWIQTPSLYEYLVQRFHSATYINDSLYEPYSFQQLRGYEKWEDFLQSQKANIKAGDVVFYWDNEIYQNWSHVAIITGNSWKLETVHVLKDFPNLIQHSAPSAAKPEIVEHHGPTYNGPNNMDIPRSIDDTSNLYIKYVSIVFMSNPK